MFVPSIQLSDYVCTQHLQCCLLSGRLLDATIILHVIGSDVAASCSCWDVLQQQLMSALMCVLRFIVTCGQLLYYSWLASWLAASTAA